MILCHCAGVTDTTIKGFIAAGASSVAEVTRCCGAGRGCAPCREAIAEMLVHGGGAHCPEKGGGERCSDGCPEFQGLLDGA